MMSNLREVAYRIDPALWVCHILGVEPTKWHEDFLRVPAASKKRMLCFLLLQREKRLAYFRRSRILSSPARAQLSSSLAPGAPLAPIAPIVSSPSLITTPPPGSVASGAIESSPFARSARAMVSFLNKTLVYALSCALY